ncbi:MAG: glycosyltransferase [Xenococcaceae cyanobacterium MO_167.B27]|nr:glycosyltransferase [Xenococcaceae cyanobacterium MO_167.B27]
MIVLTIALLSLAIWLFLLLLWGQFWLAEPQLIINTSILQKFPIVRIIIPARNEAQLLNQSLTSVLKQDYLGDFSVVLIDDNSTDSTQAIAQKTAETLQLTDKIKIISGQPLPSDWKGKLWAIEQGINYALGQQPQPDYLLLTDADIKHHPQNLTELVTKAETEKLELVSLMVLLRCESFWEKLLIPAFVFFFQKLYPFRWVNNPQSPIAAAAGGCILIRRQALEKIGGIGTIRNALIDDCTLAKTVKFANPKQPSPIWLGLSSSVVSLRPYDSLKTIWDTVARTAYTQLNYSPFLLIATLLGMVLVYLTAPIAGIFGLIIQNYEIAFIGLVTWLLMSIAYLPTIRLYKLSPFWVFTLPAIAILYALMTLDSAIRYARGQGGAWKGRVNKRMKDEEVISNK